MAEATAEVGATRRVALPAGRPAGSPLRDIWRQFRRGPGALGWADGLIMRAMDVLLAMPGVLLAITVIAILGVGLENVIGAVALESVPIFARLARASTLSVRESEYVSAARVVGAPDRRLLLRHVLPNITAPLIVMSTTRIAAVI